MKGRRALTREERANTYRRGSGIQTESVHSAFFVGGHVGVKSEREKKRDGWTEADNRETGQNAALAGTESQQFAAPD